MKIISVVGARPNFIKIAPFLSEIRNHNKNFPDKLIDYLLVHTGQHYDIRMSDNFFKDLNIPEPDINLGVGSGTHAEQVGKTMIEFEKVLKTEKPDWVVVVGDVNATLACSVTARKENIKCCHIESGLRSGDMSMPEEINRIVTDRVSDLLLAPDEISVKNLLSEGISASKIILTGNIMIDTLDANIERASKMSVKDIVQNNFSGKNPFSEKIISNEPKSFALVTLHRPSNVDIKETLSKLVAFICNVASKELNIVWPLHPRTKKNLKSFGLLENLLKQQNIFILHPVSYSETLKLNSSARLAITDSGGLQEECTVLGTPCLTLRNNTERPVTLRENNGTSILVGNDIVKITNEFYKALKIEKKPYRPPLWDGHTAERCLKAIIEKV